RVFYEGEATIVEKGISAATIDGLKQRGHRVTVRERPWGGAQAIAIDWQRGVLIGASDGRKDGSATGYWGERREGSLRERGGTGGLARPPLRLRVKPSRSALRLRQAVEPFLHVVKLALEVIDFGACAGRLFSLASLGLPPRERRKHRAERALKHFHVPPDLVLQRSERTGTEGLAHVLAKLLLLAHKRLD